MPRWELVIVPRYRYHQKKEQGKCLTHFRVPSQHWSCQRYATREDRQARAACPRCLSRLSLILATLYTCPTALEVVHVTGGYLCMVLDTHSTATAGAFLPKSEPGRRSLGEEGFKTSKDDDPARVPRGWRGKRKKNKLGWERRNEWMEDLPPARLRIRET